MNIVVDTNIFVSSFFGGNPKKVIDLWKNGEVRICVSNEIIDEYLEVLEKMGLRDSEKKKQLLSLFRRSHFLIYCSKTEKISVVENDPDDNKFIECAVALNAGIIVSGDSDLLDLKKYMGIRIMNPKDFLDFFQTNQPRNEG